MIIYSISELAEICGFERFTPKTDGDDDYGIYSKMAPEINSHMNLTKMPDTGYNGNKRIIYEVSTTHIGIRTRNDNGINIASNELTEFNKLMRQNFKGYFREEIINNLLKSDK